VVSIKSDNCCTDTGALQSQKLPLSCQFAAVAKLSPVRAASLAYPPIFLDQVKNYQRFEMSVFEFKSSRMPSRRSRFPANACLYAASINLLQSGICLLRPSTLMPSQQSRVSHGLRCVLTLREGFHAAA
jgi:hypothetical protein